MNKLSAYTTAVRSFFRATKTSNPQKQPPSWKTCFVTMSNRYDYSNSSVLYHSLYTIKYLLVFGNKVVQRIYTGNTSALCLGFPQSLRVSWRRQLNLDLILHAVNRNSLSSDTDHCSPMYIVALSQVSNHRHVVMTLHPKSWLCLHPK